MQPPATDFGAEIASRIAGREPCWFPGLAGHLVSRFWASAPDAHCADYSTASWLGEPTDGSRVLVPGQATIAVEPLPRLLARRFNAPAFAKTAPCVARAVAAALMRLRGGGAAESVATLVRSIHCVAARGPGYDCSHSEPGLPFSVLLSISVGERHAELRLAESLLHEAMHLQLTLIERDAPIVGVSAGSGYSPWQRRQRPIQGLLHGLYVFAAIHQWLRHLAADPSLPPEDRIYAERRLIEIDAEVDAVSALGSAPELTDFGRAVATWLLRDFGDVPASHGRRAEPAG